MKPGLLLVFFFCIYITDVAAQKKNLFKINPGEKVAEKIPKDEMYSYPEFVTGKVYFRNNTFYIAKMNYNSLFAEMQFIDTKGDTLSLADEKTIQLIVINTDTFYYDKGYLKLISDQGKIKLANKKFFAFANRQKLGGFGEATNGSVDTYNAVTTQSFFKDLVAQEIITLAKNNVLYIGDSYGNFKEVNKKNLFALYPDNEKEMKNYLKENKVDFSNEEDIKKLITHFKSLIPVQPL